MSPPSGPPPPPPLNPPLAQALRGPSLTATISTDTNGVVTGVTLPVASIGAAQSVMSFNPGTAAPGDETYRVQYPLTPNFDRDFRTAESTAAGYPGEVWDVARHWSDGTTTLDIFDMTNEFSGALDYVHAMRLNVGGETMFGVFGNRAGTLPTVLPERYVNADGMAAFRGATAGNFMDLDKRLYRTSSELGIEVNFRNNQVAGVASNTVLTPVSPAPAVPIGAPLPFWFDFTFNGSLTASTMTFQGAATSVSSSADFGQLSGPVSGMLFGATGEAPDEAGLTFLLRNGADTVRYWGVGAAGHVLAPRPFLTPMTQVPLGRGPSVMISASNVGIFGARGAGSSVTASTLLNVDPNVSASFNPGATSGFADDQWSINYNLNGVTIMGPFSFGAMPSYTGFGTIYESFLAANGATNGTHHVYHHNIGFDLSDSLAGALDNVFLVSVQGNLFDKNQNNGFVVFGTQTAAANMPTSGSATFKGNTRGVYLDAVGNLYNTDSKLTMDANFATGAVSGAATDFRSSGDFFTGQTSDKLDFNFNASINSGTSTFSGTAASAAGGVGLTGHVEGAFYGAPGVAPDEAGIAYQLGNPGGGAFMAGGGIMAKQ